MAIYKDMIDTLLKLKKEGKGAHVNVNPEHAARMRLQNQFQSGIFLYYIVVMFESIFAGWAERN